MRFARFRGWPRLTVRGFGFLAMSIVLFIVAPALGQREIAFAASVALALPLLALLLVSVRHPKLSVVRRFTPETASAGTDCEVSLAIQNWGMAPTPAASWIDGTASAMGSTRSATLPSLSSFRSLESDTPRVFSVRYLLEAPRRGKHNVGPLHIRLSDPFGFATRQFPVGNTDTLIVTPEVETLSRGSFRLPSGDGQSMQSRRPSGSGEQDVIARKYQTGDSMRRVHWPATARHSELMVRQDDQHNDHEAVIVLDTRRESYEQQTVRGSQAALSDEFEWAVSMSASIALHLLDEGYRVRLVDSQTHEASADDTATANSSELLLRGANIELSDGAPPLAVRDLVPDAGPGSSERPPLFAVLGNIDSESIEALARASSTTSSALAFVVHSSSRAIPAWAISLQDALERASWNVRLVSSSEARSTAWESGAAGVDR